MRDDIKIRRFGDVGVCMEKSHLSKLGRKLLNNCVDTKMIPINNKSSVNIN